MPPTGAVGAPIVAENLAEWKGQDVLGPEGDKLGKLEDVFYDAETDVPAFAAIKRGRIGKRLTLVPLRGASVTRSFLRVAHDKKQVRDAPSWETDAELSIEDESAIYRFFGLDYVTVGLGARRLAKR
jgi:hypothetical protein